MRKKILAQIKKLPNSSGVYLFKKNKEIIYVGKSNSLKKRVSSYFRELQDHKTKQLILQISSFAFKKTETNLEALILEASLINKYQPKYNVRFKDDKSYTYLGFTREDFPRPIFLRGLQLKKDIVKTKKEFTKIFGPFESSYSLRLALKTLRKIFPYRCNNKVNGKRACLYFHLHLCPGTCLGMISKKDYQKIIKNLFNFFEGKKKRVISNLEKEMKISSKNKDFEKAAEIRNRLFALNHLQDTAFIREDVRLKSNISKVRVEGYDISNISGLQAVGSMVVFAGGRADKSSYRRFKIRANQEINDLAMTREVIMRRFKHLEWNLPDLILIDGGLGQVKAALSAIGSYKIPIIGIAKGKNRRGGSIINPSNFKIEQKMLYQVRDEAHRFALAYHRLLRKKKFFSK